MSKKVEAMSLLDAVMDVHKRLLLPSRANPEGGDIRAKLIKDFGEYRGNQMAARALQAASAHEQRLILFGTEEAEKRDKRHQFKMKPETIHAWLEKMAPDEYVLQTIVYVLKPPK